MRLFALYFLIVLTILACKKTPVLQPDQPIDFRTKLILKASAPRIFLSDRGQTMLAAFDEWDNDLTDQTRFEVNGQPLTGNIFKPSAEGSFEIRAFFKNLESQPVVITAQKTGRRKVLMEYFTTQTCGWCPYAGFRVDSLQRAEPNLVTICVHGHNDELSTPLTAPYENMMRVTGRPTVFVARRFVDVATFKEFRNVADTALADLAAPAEVGIAVESHFSGDVLNVTGRLRAFESVSDSLFFTLLLLENDVLTSFQANYFSGSSLNTPFQGQPDPILNFVNQRVLRRSATDIEGQFMFSNAVENQDFLAGNWSIDVAGLKKDRLTVVGICHRKKLPDQFSVASVVNAQQVMAGESVDFDE